MSAIYPPLEKLEPMPELIREVYSEQKFKRLKKDIAKRSVLNPLHGIKDGKNILIYDGIHRLLALRAVNKQRIENDEDPYGVPVYVHNIPRKEAIVWGYLANDLHEDVNPVDSAKIIQRMRKEGMKSPEIAKALGLSESYVRRMWMLLRLDERILRRVKENRLDYTKALLLMRINDPNERIVACEEIVKHPTTMTRQIIEDLINNGRWGEPENVTRVTSKGLTTFCELCGERLPYKDTRTKQICLNCLKEIPSKTVKRLTARKRLALNVSKEDKLKEYRRLFKEAVKSKKVNGLTDLPEVHAHWDEDEDGFRCDIKGDKVEDGYKICNLVYEPVSMVLHLEEEHGIPHYEQVIEGWKRKHQELYEKYLEKSSLKN